MLLIGSDCASTTRAVASYSFVWARLKRTAAAVTIPVSSRISGIRRRIAFRYAPRSCSAGAPCCASSAAIGARRSLGTAPEAHPRAILGDFWGIKHQNSPGLAARDGGAGLGQRVRHDAAVHQRGAGEERGE